MPVPVILYHHVDEPPPHGKFGRSHHVSPQTFGRQMRILKRLGFQGLSLKEAMPYINGEKHGRVVAITFDDGMMSVYKHAMPVLNELGFTATNYFVTGQIGGQNAWDIPEARPAPCMGKAELLDWVAHGHETGAHTLDHVHLPQIDEHEAERQISQSKQELENILGQEVISFAYPYGEENPLMRRLVRQAGFQYGVTTAQRRANTHEDPFGVPRYTIRCKDTRIGFLAKCLWRK